MTQEPQLDAFASPVETVDGVADGPPVEVPHSGDAFYARGSDGRRYIKKFVDPAQFLAESIAYILASYMELPVPVGRVCWSGQDAFWLSEFVPDVQHWSLAQAPLVENLDDLGGILVLDAVLGVPDRHMRNILIGHSGSGHKLWGIDFANAIVGHPPAYERLGLGRAEITSFAQSIPTDLLVEGLNRGAERARLVDGGSLAGAVHGAARVARVTITDRYLATLRDRLAHSETLVHAHLAHARSLR